MAVIIWTGADASTIRKVFSPIMQRQHVEHRVEPDLSKLPNAKPGDIVLACGTKALMILIGLGLFPKNRTVTSCRETPRLHNGVHYFVTFDPGITSRDYARFPDLQWDLQLCIRLQVTGSVTPQLGTYEWVESFHELIEDIDRQYEKTGKPMDMACDTETLGLDEYHPGNDERPPARIISISFTIKEGESKMMYFGPQEKPVQPEPWEDIESIDDYWKGVWIQLHWLLTTNKVKLRGANWKYDSRWLNRQFAINCTNFKFDTMLAGTLLNENISNSLKMHAKLHTPLGGYEDGLENVDMGRMDLVPKEKIGQYMGADTDSTFRVAKVFVNELKKDRGLINFYTKVLHPSSTVFEKMERNGVVVDVPYMKELEHEIETEQKRLHVEMKKAVPRKIWYKYLDAFEDETKNPFAKPTLMRDLFFSPQGFNLHPTQFTEKSADASTAMDHLLTFGDEPDASQFINLLSELNSANKTMSTYVRGFMKHIRVDGRFHPHYMLFRGDYGNDADDSGTDTGRTSAKDPAVQTIPKHTKWAKRLRRAYTCPSGKTIIQLDFSQGELRIAACLANEHTMIQAYKDGRDLHSVTGAKLAGYSYDDFLLLPDDIRDPFRSQAKPANFGLLYGMGAEGLMQYAFVSFGLKLSLKEANDIRDAFFELYSGLTTWHKHYKSLAKQWGYIRSPLGRLRHLPLIHSRDRDVAAKAERNGVNSPVQSTLSDMMQLAQVEIDRQYPTSDLELFMMTHDSTAAYVPIEEAEIWAKRLKPILDNLPLKEMFNWDHQLQFTSDVEIARPDDHGVLHLGGLKKFKVAA